DALVQSNYISSTKAAFKTYDIFGLQGQALPKNNLEDNRDAKDYGHEDKIFPTICDMEGSSAFLREVFLSLEGMDPLLFGHEGSDLTYRIAKKHGDFNKIIYWPDTVIYHDAFVGNHEKEKVKRYELLERYLNFKHNGNIFSSIRRELEKYRLSGNNDPCGPHHLATKRNLEIFERPKVGKRDINQHISVIPTFKSEYNPLVSVVMPAYNAAEYITEAIESVLIQNYRNFELIVIDDGSTDNTRDIVSSFKDDKIKYFYQENKGLAGAHNAGIKNSKGHFLIKLDSDDVMTPDYIAKHLQEFEYHPEADLVYCDDYLIDENSKPIRVIKRPEYTDRKTLIRDLFHCGFPVVPFRTCIRRSVFDKIGFFDENLRIAEDYDMMRRFVKYGLKIQHLPDALYLRRMTSDSLSRNFTTQKAKYHFDVINRFLDTFTYDELFPDVAWDKIEPQMRQLHAKCLAAGTYLAIGQEYIKTNAIEYSRTAFDRACSELNDCIKMDPENQDMQQLLQKSKLIRARYTKAPQQVVSKR
ncbi:MAG: glycosyltransferase, partial [Planctomycetes bacterium]|nr:glycosyltransferase [Planctomycetota bacterium]